MASQQDLLQEAEAILSSEQGTGTASHDNDRDVRTAQGSVRATDRANSKAQAAAEHTLDGTTTVDSKAQAAAEQRTPDTTTTAGASSPLDTMPDDELLYDLADSFKVYADTTRIKILYALMGTDRCVADIAEIIGATQSATSHQLRILKQARLVKFQREGKNIVYSLSDDHVYTVLAQGMIHLCE